LLQALPLPPSPALFPYTTLFRSELRSVSKRYPDQREPAIADLSFTVPAGEVCVLVGPSGSGKTTTMRLINRMIPLTAGDILLGGHSVLRSEPRALRREIGYVIQQVGLFPHQTVAQNIATDPINRAHLQDEFLGLQEKVRKTVVFVTHDIDEAIKMGDRIAILREGGVLAQYDTPAAILSHPADEFVSRFVGADRALKRLALKKLDELELRPLDGAAPDLPRLA